MDRNGPALQVAQVYDRLPLHLRRSRLRPAMSAQGRLQPVGGMWESESTQQHFGASIWWQKAFGRRGSKSLRALPGRCGPPLLSRETRRPHWDALKRPDTSDNGSREGRQELSMSDVEDARSLDAHRVNRIASFAIFAFERARRYYNVSWSPDQK
jgi:hypothetical protein